ncbi:MAG: Mur ligase family protein, partial [Pseudomonadota bacterium]
MSALHPAEIDLTLDRMRRLLEALGHPERNLPPVIHVAGTNGKGSTIAMVRAGLEASGQSVHAYTSPHLMRFHERIVLCGQDISEARLCDVLRRTVEANGASEITYFEATTAAAFLAFSEVPADALLLEVGLGGRLDATNVVRPKICAITPIALDHQEFLGDTLEKIAGEKAAILKRGTPGIVARQTPEVEAVIEDAAARIGAPLQTHGQDWQVSEERGRVVFQDEAGLLDLPAPALPGAHQIENAGTALAVLRALGLGEAQARAQDPNVLGYGTVLSMAKLSADDRAAFEALDLGVATLTPAELGPALPEPHPSWTTRIAEDWI